MPNKPRIAGRFTFNNVGVALAVLLTAWAAIQSQVASNKVTEVQASRDREQACTSQVVFSALEALDQRYRYASDQAESNVELQKAQADLLRNSFRPNTTEAESRAAFERYFESLTEFIRTNTAIIEQGEGTTSPYPTPSEYAECLTNARAESDQ